MVPIERVSSLTGASDVPNQTLQNPSCRPYPAVRAHIRGFCWFVRCSGHDKEFWRSLYLKIPYGFLWYER